VVIGTIVGWLPPSEEDEALWHIVHGDGDEEDLDLQEVQAYLVPLPGEEITEDAEVEGEDGEGAVDEEENEEEADGDEENEEEVENTDKEENVVMDVEETKSAISNAPSNVSAKTSTTNQTTSGVPSKRRIIIDDDEEDEMSDPGIGAPNVDSGTSSTMNNSKGTAKPAPIPLIPKILKQPYGLSKPATYARNVPAIGISGIEQELLRLVQIYYDNLKKRVSNTEEGVSVMSKDLRKHYENRVNSILSLFDAKEIILDLEELIHSTQTVPDKLDLEEELKKQQAKRQEMLAEGWIFEDNKGAAGGPISGEAFLGCRARRYFPEFGKSDCTVHAMLPADKNDGIQLFRLVHSDNDEEDVDEKDVALAVECFKQQIETEEEASKLLASGNLDPMEDTNTSATSVAPAATQNKSKKVRNDTEENEEDEEEGAEQVEIDYYAEPGSEDELDAVEKLTKASPLLLWPTKEIRARWRTIILNSQTVGEIVMALAVFEEQSYRFGVLDHDTGASTALYGSTTSVVPLMFFRPPASVVPKAAGKSSSSSNIPSVAPAERTYRTQGGGHHRMLSPRKAKKRAIGELSRYDNSWDSDNNNDDDFDDEDSDGHKSSRYPKRSTRSAAVSSSSSSYGNSDYYNSGRPSRAAAQRVVSYAE
jgi:hypothetical protein